MKRRDFINTMPVVAIGLSTMASSAGATTQAANATGRYANVLDFGAIGDGVHDDTSAIQAAINSLAGAGGGVYLPPGAYVLSSALTLIPNLTVVGFGGESVKLLPKSAGINVFQYLAPSDQFVNISISGIEIDCTSVGGITGVYFQSAQRLSLQDMVFTGCSYSAQMDRCRFVEIGDCVSRGSPWNKAGTLKLFSANATEYIHDVNVRNYIAVNIGNGIANGHAIIIHRGVANLVQGFILNDGHVGGDVHGVAFYGDCQGCKVSNSIIGSCGGGIYFGKDMFTANTILPSFTTVSNVDVDQPQAGGIWVSAGNWITVTGGNFTCSNANTHAQGVLIESGSMITVIGVTANGFSTGNGILVGGGVSNVTIAQCQVDQCQTGIGVVSGSGKNLSIMGNRLVGNTNPIIFGATGGGSLVRNNIGYGDVV